MVAVAESFVITSGGEDEVLVVDDCSEDGYFRADKTFLHEQSPFAKAFFGENLVEEIEGGILIRADRDALACGESVELEYGWILPGDGFE